ncbi:hypothetical protein FSST1_002343 [Fusarium sambucinum]
MEAVEERPNLHSSATVAGPSSRSTIQNVDSGGSDATNSAAENVTHSPIVIPSDSSSFDESDYEGVNDNGNASILQDAGASGQPSVTRDVNTDDAKDNDAGSSDDTDSFDDMSEGAHRHHSVAIATLEKNRTENQRKGYTFQETEEWRNSAARNRDKFLKLMYALPKNRHEQKKVAMFNVRQVIELAAADRKDLTPVQQLMQSKLHEFDNLSHAQQQTFLNQHVAFRAPFCLDGLRYEGDGCPDPDIFDYTTNHPLVNMEKKYRKGEKEKLYVFKDEE